MVDCRPASGAPHEPHSAPNGTAPPENHHSQVQQSGGSGDVGNHGVTSPGRASTPAAVPTHVQYTTQYQSAPMNHVAHMGAPMPLGTVPPYMGYMCGAPSLGAGGKGVGGAGGAGLVWMPPPLPPPPHHVNPHAHKSMQANGADLPMNDIPTLRYYFNLGVDCMWAAYGPPPPLPPPRHYSPRDVAQDMQQLSLQDRGNNHQDMGHKHNKPSDKHMQNNGKGNGQRSLLGPRFNKRGNGQDGNPNPNHNQNKSHNNNNHMANKGPNNRTYYSRSEPRHYPEGGEAPPCQEPPLLTLPYIPYPPPVYPVQYYPVDANDPAMMGMMGGMQYCGYEELEYPHYYQPYAAPPVPCAAPPAAPPAPPAHHAPQPALQLPHHEHK